MIWFSISDDCCNYTNSSTCLYTFLKFIISPVTYVGEIKLFYLLNCNTNYASKLSNNSVTVVKYNYELDKLLKIIILFTNDVQRYLG